MWKRLITLTIVIAAVFAFWQVPADLNVKSLTGGIIDRSETLRIWITQIGDGIQEGRIDLGVEFNEPEPLEINFDLPEYDPKASDFNSDLMSEAAATIPTIDFDEEAPYNRGDWYHWANHERSCWSVREEVLYRDADKTQTLTLLDKNKIPTQNKDEACYISGGTWIDPYTGEEFNNPSDLDIDHMIPLSYANKGGGYAWGEERKRDFANSLDYEYHLVAASASANRSKSDKGPSDWKPENENYHCEYAAAWTTISNNWGVSLTSSDKNTITNMLKSCR